MEDWRKKTSGLTKSSLGGASLSLWDIKSILDLATPEEVSAWHSLKMQYSALGGGAALKQSISEHYSNLSTDNIVVFSGAAEALTCLYLSLLTKDSKALALTPYYAPMNLAIQNIGAHISEHSLQFLNNKWQLNFPDFNKKITTGLDLLVVNFPHNPTGFIPKRSNFESMINKAQTAGTWVICDEVFKGLELNKDNAIPPVCDLYERGVSVGSLSKAYGCPAARIGWIATHDKDLIEKLLTVKRYFSICASQFDEFIATIMIKNKETVLSKNKEFIQKNLHILTSEYLPELSTWLNFSPLSAGLVMFPELKINENSEQFCTNFLKESGCRLEPGSCFGEQHNKYFRLGLGSNKFSEGLHELKYFLGKYYRS